MVPEGLSEGAALSAPEPVADGNPEAEAEVAESTEVAVEGSTGFNWADASEDATAPTTGFTEAGGAASGAPGDEEDFDILKLDALSLLDPVKPTAEELFEALEAEPASEPADQPTASDPIEADNTLESENPDNQTPKEEIDFTDNPDLQETSAEVADSVAEPIVGSSPTLEEASDLTTVFAPVYVEYPAEAAEEDEVPPPPTSPFLEQVGAASGASTSGHVQTGHSPSAPSSHPASVALRVARRNRQNV